MKKVFLIGRVLLFNGSVNAQWKFDPKKTKELELERNVYTCRVGSIKIEKMTSESSPNIDFESSGGLIEFFSRGLDRDAAGDGFFINTKDVLDDIIRNPENRYTVSILFTDGTIMEKK